MVCVHIQAPPAGRVYWTAGMMMTRNYGNMNASVNLKLNDFYIVEAECCRTWPVALGFRLNPCGLCEEVPVTKNPLVVIREPVVHSD